MIYTAGRWVRLDLSAGHGLFGRAWPRLCAGYVAGAIGLEPRPSFRLGVGVALATAAQGEAEPQ